MGTTTQSRHLTRNRYFIFAVFTKENKITQHTYQHQTADCAKFPCSKLYNALHCVKFPFGDKRHSSEQGVSVGCASASEAESWCVHYRSAVPALVCIHKVCRRCAAEVPPSISSPVDKNVWHVAQQSFETATSQKVNQPEYRTL
jgi:hypothetical protein